MKKQNFSRRSYDLEGKTTLSEKYEKKDRKLRFGFNNLAFEPELKEFVIEGWNGEKRRSKNYRAGWNIDEHKISLTDLALRYGTDLINGLPEVMVATNRQKYGENLLKPPKKKSEWIKLSQSILLGLNLLLWVCGIVTLGASVAQFLTDDPDDAWGSLYSGGSLIVVVLVAGGFTYYQEFQSSKTMESFRNMVPQFVTVIRDGTRLQLNSTELVVGDIIEVNYGDKLAADIRIIESQGLKVDNSSITGESDPQKRSTVCTDKDPMETKNLAFFSTGIVEGTAKGFVIKVGHSTLIGRLATLASSVDPKNSPISKEMYRIIAIITSLSLVFGVIFFVIGLSMNHSWLNSLFFVVGIVVGNVPENLNVTLTIILALAAKKMAKKHCLVKQLHAVETLGSTSVICSDKTGTLTQNKMSVAHLWFNDTIAEADTTEFATGQGTYDINDPGFTELSKVAILCSRAKFKPGQDDIPILARSAEGDSSEVAILKCMEMQIGNVDAYRKINPKVFEIPFNSVNKYQISVHSNTEDTSDIRYFVAMKGAPEKIMDVCSTILIGGKEIELDDECREKIKDAYISMASFGERVLGFCDCRLPLGKYPPYYIFNEEYTNLLEEGFRFVGLISMIDPPRAAVPDAVLRCRSAGIKVAMITGDHPVTATAIARAVNIISEDEINEEYDGIRNGKGKAAVITGSELKEMSIDQLQCFISLYNEIVYARTSPEQKYDIVKAYQKLGHVVAVTGDGVNDSPALKKADIGIAMGSGTDVSKEVADMILMDDNFASIVDGVEDGRVIFDNLKKLIRYTMADNVAEMYCYWIFIILKVPLPMGTIAMLLSTLGADVFPAVSLAHESAESDIMKLKPRDPNTDKLMTLQMISYSYGQIACIETFAGFFSYFVTFACYGWLPHDLLFSQSRYESKDINDLEDSYGQEWTYDSRSNLEKQAQTAFFIALVICQFANAICCKTRRVSVFQKGMQNKLMNVGLVMMIAVPCVFIYTPGLNTAVSFVPIWYESWLAALPFAIFLFVYDECRRLAVRSGISAWISHEFMT